MCIRIKMEENSNEEKGITQVDQSSVQEVNTKHIEKITASVRAVSPVEEMCTEEKNISIKNGSEQVSSFKFTDSIKNDEQLQSMTGIESFTVLNKIVDVMKVLYGDNLKEKDAEMDTRDRIVMTYIKLKQNLSNKVLSNKFNIPSEDCQKIFFETVKILSKGLKLAIPWPSKSEIHRNLPMSFEGFENVRIVISCIEVLSETQKKLKANSCLSKIMIGFAPAGLVSFISEVYDGAASWTVIFTQSDLRKRLEKGDAIIVDTELFIEDLCENNNWQVIKPPILENEENSIADHTLSSKIAAAREHIEKSIKLIKNFGVLKGKMSTEFVPILEEIFTVICATSINLNTPILPDDKFIK